MDWDEEDDNLYRIETLTLLRQERARQSTFKPNINNPVKIDVGMEESSVKKAAPAGEKAGIKAKPAQGWVSSPKRLQKRPWKALSQIGTFTKNDCSLTVKRLSCHPVTKNYEATLLKRKKWIKKWSQTDMFYISNCIFVDEAAFDINMRPATTARSTKDIPVVVTTPSARAASHAILEAISSLGALNIT
ncbi:hypothetical protein [Parasitella parasitica]|uniref:Uncharacterized protein n=1 Tax=Parasitella parasitica TaxID=35722 RepID=A0A0B7N4Z2_9FUNG|nr:hypothetical protein [Parasitella parasitica]